MEKKQLNLAIFVDFKKAFDFVNSDLLLLKLRAYGFDAASLKLFSNYFTNRKQMVKYNNIDSLIADILLGVPQGSVLGPLLFLIFINDLIFDFDENKNCILFADDTTIHTSGSNMESCVDSLSQEIEKLSTWCTYNRLQVNWDKTFMMPVCEKRVFKQYNFCSSYMLGKTTITMVQQFKLLGVLLDSTLTFMANVEETCKKVRAALFSLKSKFFLSNETRLQFFKTFVLPHFDYCISLSIYYTTELRMTLVKLYNFCLRKLGLVRLDKFDHVRDIDSMAFNSILQKHGLFSFSCRVFYRLSLFVHNVFNQDNESVLRDCFYKTTHHYSLRHTQRLHVVVSKRACDDLNFFIFGPKFINFLYIDTIFYSFSDFKTFLLSNFDYLYQIFHEHFCFFTY